MFFFPVKVISWLFRVVRGVVRRVVRGAGQWVVRGSGVSLFYFPHVSCLNKYVDDKNIPCVQAKAWMTALSEERLSANAIAIWTRVSACSEVISLFRARWVLRWAMVPWMASSLSLSSSLLASTSRRRLSIAASSSLTSASRILSSNFACRVFS